MPFNVILSIFGLDWCYPFILGLSAVLLCMAIICLQGRKPEKNPIIIAFLIPFIFACCILVIRYNCDISNLSQIIEGITLLSSYGLVHPLTPEAPILPIYNFAERGTDISNSASQPGNSGSSATQSGGNGGTSQPGNSVNSAGQHRSSAYNTTLNLPPIRN